MAVNQVIYGGETLIDLTGDTVTPETLLEGITAHNAMGELIIGTLANSDPGGNSRVITGTITIESETQNTIIPNAFPAGSQAPKAFWIFETGKHPDDTSHTKYRLIMQIGIREDGGTGNDANGTYYAMHFLTYPNSNSGSNGIKVLSNGFDGTQYDETVSIPQPQYVLMGNCATGELFLGSVGNYGLIAGRTYNWGVWLCDE